MNRKRVILGALLGVLAVCLVYAYLATPRLEKAPPRAVGQGGKQAVSEKLPEVDEKESRGRIDFTYLTAEQQEFTGAQRDIFRFGQRHLIKPVPPVVEKQVPVPVIVREVVPVEVVQKSLSQFTFLGFLEKGGEKTVFLSSGGNLFLVKQGERFGTGQEFLVEQIDNKLLKVRHAGREGLIEIELIEKQKLNAAVSAPVSISRDSGPERQPANARAIRPRPRPVRPVAPQEDQNFQGDETLLEEYDPDAVQEQENPGDENAPEGEVNGKNQ